MNSCYQCNKCGMDMDMAPYCVQTDVLAKRTEVTGRDYPWGLDLNHARPLCQGEFFETRVTTQKE